LKKLFPKIYEEKKMGISNLVLSFYKKLPFNVYTNSLLAIQNIKNNNLKNTYPFLNKYILNTKKIIDVGCGGGWLANTISYHYNKNVFGIDFNSKAIKHAKKISKLLKNQNQFYIKDIFSHKIKEKFDLICSIGVLHHTKNCMKALDICCKFGKKGSIIVIGLYHKEGRKAFLEKFNKNKYSEKKLFKEYINMHTLTDTKHQISWFRDQVLHAHETQHRLQEVLDVFKKNNYRFMGTSINRFSKKDSIGTIKKKEKKLYDYGLKKIKKNIYYPGFFIVVGKKIR